MNLGARTTQGVLGDYRIVRKLGAGGMAEVFLAKQNLPNGTVRAVVIKAILTHLIDDQRFVDMFMQEARVAALLQHPNICAIHDVTVLDGRPCIILEFLQGRDLWTVLTRLGDGGSVIKARPAAAIIAQAASALDYAHARKDQQGRPLDLVHRDVSPHNLFLTRRGEVKVLDFGIAKSAFQQNRTESGVIKGKLAYMAPEQARGKDVDFRADQFALGVVLWEMLTGKRLFARDDALQTVTAMFQEETPRPSSIRPVPEGLEAIVMRALEMSPTDRFDSCESMAVALRATLGATQPDTESRLVRKLLAHAVPEDEDREFYAPDRNAREPTNPKVETEQRDPSHSGVESRLDMRIPPMDPTTGTALVSEAKPKRTGLWVGIVSLLVVASVLGGVLYWKLGSPPSAPIVTHPPNENPASVEPARISFANVPEGVVIEIDGVLLESYELLAVPSDEVHHVRALHEDHELWRYDAIFRASSTIELPVLTLPEDGAAPEVSNAAPLTLAADSTSAMSTTSMGTSMSTTSISGSTMSTMETPPIRMTDTPVRMGMGMRLGMQIDLGYP